jgi:hypothetical protein
MEKMTLDSRRSHVELRQVPAQKRGTLEAMRKGAVKKRNLMAERESNRAATNLPR